MVIIIITIITTIIIIIIIITTITLIRKTKLRRYWNWIVNDRGLLRCLR